MSVDLGYHTLRGHEVVSATREEWMALWEQGPEVRRVAQDVVADQRVSTVFLGMDHGFGGTPLFFETMIFHGDDGREEWRYATWEEAEAGHRAVVQALRDGVDPYDRVP